MLNHRVNKVIAAAALFFTGAAQAQEEPQLLDLNTNVGRYIAQACTNDNHTVEVKFGMEIDLGRYKVLQDLDTFEARLAESAARTIPAQFAAVMKDYKRADLQSEKGSDALRETLKVIQQFAENAGAAENTVLVPLLYVAGTKNTAGCAPEPALQLCRADMSQKPVANGVYPDKCAKLNPR